MIGNRTMRLRHVWVLLALAGSVPIMISYLHFTDHYTKIAFSKLCEKHPEIKQCPKILIKNGGAL